jgi:hypothetical protein
MPETVPISDSVPKVNNEVAVGDDLEFQYRWWKFEHAVWVVFVLIVIADLLGCFGRGWLAKAEYKSPDGLMDIHYERVERFSTPSILTINFAPSAVHDEEIHLWASDSLVKPLGNQRVVPSPQKSALSNSGISYTFPASNIPSSVEFALQPASPGIIPVSFQVADGKPVTLKIYVMP